MSGQVAGSHADFYIRPDNSTCKLLIDNNYSIYYTRLLGFAVLTTSKIIIKAGTAHLWRLSMVLSLWETNLPAPLFNIPLSHIILRVS